MKHYTYDEHYGRLESYRGSSDKLFLTERLTHSDATLSFQPFEE